MPNGDGEASDIEVLVRLTNALEDVPAVAKGEAVVPASAANPEVAKADADVCFRSVVAGSAEGGFVATWGAFDARSTNGEVIELSATVLDGMD